MLFSTVTFALGTDFMKAVHIESEQQMFDLKTNKVIFEGKVKVTQGSIKVLADKVEIIQDKKTSKIKQILAYGKPATVSQLMKDGKKLVGQAEHINYQIDTSRL